MFGLDPHAARKAEGPVVEMEVRRSLLFPFQEIAVPKAQAPRSQARGGCPPVDFGGRTVESPCPSLGPDFCLPAEFTQMRGLYLLEIRAIEQVLNQWNDAVKAKKTTWLPIPTAAWQTYETAWELLEKYPYDWADGIFNTNQLQVQIPIVEMIKMGAAVHQATCDVKQALVGIGEQVPADPQLPEEKPGPVEKAFTAGEELLSKLASGVVYLAVGLGGAALLAAVAYAVYNKGKR